MPAAFPFFPGYGSSRELSRCFLSSPSRAVFPPRRYGRFPPHRRKKSIRKGYSEEKEKDVDNTATNGILPRLVDVVHIFETVAAQYVRHEVHIHPLACMQFQCILSQFLTRDHLFGQRIRIGHHAKPLFSFLQATQHFCTEYFVCRILLPVLDGAAERRRKKTIPALSPISASKS